MTMNNETTAEVLAAHELPAMFRRAALGVFDAQATVYEYCADQLDRSLAAGKVAPTAWMLLGKDSGEGTRYVSLTPHADTAERYKGEMEIVPLYTAQPAKASKPEVTREMALRAIAARNDYLETSNVGDAVAAMMAALTAALQQQEGNSHG